MNAILRRSAVTLLVAAFLVSLLAVSVSIASSEGSQAKIDLFTQNEPYSGRGLNMPSDAFGPEQRVLLYAFVMFNDAPVESVLVAYETSLPNGTCFYLSAVTNSSGFAVANFTTYMPRGNVEEGDVFGLWSVLAKSSIDGFEFQDTMTFKVGWIVKLISVRAIYENLTDGTVFGLGGKVGFEVSLRSIAMSLKSAMITIVIQDEVHVPVSYLVIRDFQVQPNEKLVYAYFRLTIPTWAFVGDAAVYVSALTGPASEGGIPYCPEVTTSFYISPYISVDVVFHDIAVVYVVPSSASVEKGQNVNVTVVVTNEGTEMESFSVTAYCGDFVIGTSMTVSVAPYSKAVFSFDLDTFLFFVGNHTLKASIPHLVSEADLTDNLYIDGTFEIRAKPPLLVHDVAVINIIPSAGMVYIGDTVIINVIVKNVGNFMETFNVTLYYDTFVVGTVFVNNLEAQAERTLTFHWSTQELPERTFKLSALASSVPGEENLVNNQYVDGSVMLRNRPAPVHDIAVLKIVPASRLVSIGDVLDVNVTVKNKGTVAESFNVILYYEQNIAGTLRISNLAAGTEQALIFHWSTEKVAKGNYTLIVFAEPVTGEKTIADNYLEDGEVRFISGPRSFFGLDLFFWFFIWLLLLLFLLLVLFWLFYRRRKKKSEQTFYSGWTAWYYAYDPRDKQHKL